MKKKIDKLLALSTLCIASLAYGADQNASAQLHAEMIFDPRQNKLMVHFTTRLPGGHNYLAYAYANQAFITLETSPERLFTYPAADKSTIDKLFRRQITSLQAP